MKGLKPLIVCKTIALSLHKGLSFQGMATAEVPRMLAGLLLW